PAHVGVAAQVARDEDQLLTVDLQRAADDGLDAELAARLEVTYRAVDASVVGDGEGGHLELGRTHGELVGVRAAIEEREVRVAVQLDVRRGHFSRRAEISSASVSSGIRKGSTTLGSELLPGLKYSR